MQLTFEGKTLDQLAIELLQAYEPPEGYYLGFSGGKDSVVIKHLAERARVKYQAYYNVSPIDSKLIHNFIKLNYPEVIWEYNAKDFWNLEFMANGYPTRISRWCCRIIKECGGEGRVKVLGMRKDESNTRSEYDNFMIRNSKNNTSWLLPILNWSDADVWQYISEHNITFSALYRHGFKRIGCILCPFSSKDDIKLCMNLFPKIVNLWKLYGDKYIKMRWEHWYDLEKSGKLDKRHKKPTYISGEEYFNWWIKR
jgi:phosphoadenosine phosphosulfate reductase